MEANTVQMIITYRVFESSLDRYFEHKELFATLADFRLYAYSVWSGRWEILHVEEWTR